MVVDCVFKAALLLRRRLPFRTRRSIQGLTRSSFTPLVIVWLESSSPLVFFTNMQQSGCVDKSCSLHLFINFIVSVSTPSVRPSASVSCIHPTRAPAAQTVTKAFEMTVTTASTCRLGLSALLRFELQGFSPLQLAFLCQRFDFLLQGQTCD